VKRVTALVAAFLLGCAACHSDSPQSAPRLPEGSAGRIVQRAIDASGGWERWTGLRDVAFVTTFTAYDPVGNISSESIGLHKSPLHGSPLVRFESLGVPNPVTFGFDGKEAWILRNGLPVNEPGRLEWSRFNMVSNAFWFSLPFSLAELPVAITDLGQQADGATRWQRLRVTLDKQAPEAPCDWFVVYFDPETGLIDHVLSHITASFLTHSLWVGKWLDYQDWNGIKKERRRQFFPADAEGAIIGNLVVEQLVEDVRFNNNFPASLFTKPVPVSGGEHT